MKIFSFGINSDSKTGVVDDAYRHMNLACRDSFHELSGTRWQVYLKKIRRTIGSLSTVKDVIAFAQKVIGFDHRQSVSVMSPFFALYEDTLISEFPRFSGLIRKMSESPFSRPDTIISFRGRLVSNIFYFHARYVFFCLEHITRPKVVCEIGGGYGGPCRLWMDNPVHSPDTYIMIDFPECLFFAEIFLRANFAGREIVYVTGGQKIDPGSIKKGSIILCPIQFTSALGVIPIDLVVNTGSLQEMSEDWVAYWMKWLTESDCRFFYSLNYFAQPLGFLAEGANSWSPRLPDEWRVRLQRFNPPFVKLQSPRNFAEIIAEKTRERPDRAFAENIYKAVSERFFDGQAFLEAMDLVRLSQSHEMAWDVLERCVTRLDEIPKEAYYLAEYLAAKSSSGFRSMHGEKLEQLRVQLRRVRSAGRENVV